jgi:hypothetical protein
VAGSQSEFFFFGFGPKLSGFGSRYTLAACQQTNCVNNNNKNYNKSTPKTTTTTVGLACIGEIAVGGGCGWHDKDDRTPATTPTTTAAGQQVGRLSPAPPLHHHGGLVAHGVVIVVASLHRHGTVHLSNL